MELIFLAISFVICIFFYFYFKKKLETYTNFKSAINENKKILEQTLSELKEAQEKLDESLMSFNKINEETQELQDLKKNANILSEQVVEDNKLKLKIQEKIAELSSQEQDYIDRVYAIQSKIDLYSTLEEFSDVGHFEIPDYLYQTSERFAEEIRRVREEQKDLIKSKEAIFYNETALNTVLGTTSDAKRVLDGQIKLMLLAFNEDCDLLISKVRPGYYPKTLERIEKLANELEKLSIHFQCQFNIRYIELKLTECTLQYQYRLKKQEEDEEQRFIREQIKEEQKARREYEKAIADAEREEKMYQELLNKARAELEYSNSEKMIAIQAQIALLEQQLAEAQSREERARSLAEQTRRGYIYIISNIGSFGENVYKIGLTRRLDPMERIKELGDASVPFFFDVHAFIYSEDAPTLESMLHKRFDSQRVNAVNIRREFFEVDLEEIKHAVEELTGNEAEFHMTALAEEYYETRRIRGI
ncbi:DUF4041 domain-containing protein [Mannheimia sp. E30BD]|uniref:DUF4041 domain-containing protein n=1 Tax=Mannheimia sp. E30BD TaxID=3278708 RepID=UPI00359D38EE